MASSAEQTLQQISDYIDKYEHDLALRESIVNLGNATTRQQIAMQKAHLADLKAKYAYLQTYYAQHGELPATVHFDAHTNDGAGMYRTEQGGEIKMVTLVAGASGTQIVTAPDFTGTLSVSNPDMPTSAYRYGTAQERNQYGMQLGSWAYTGVDWTVTGTLFTGMHVANSWAPGTYWSVALDMGSEVELITGSNQMNAHVFKGGVYFSLDEDDVPTDSIWDYYNDDILPNINPDNAAIPEGYHPVEPDDPPDEPTDIPHDDGEPPEHQRDRAVGIPSQFITQYLLSYSQLQTFGLNLWQTWLTPNTDVWKNFFLPYGQDFGTLNIGACLDFIISLRVYPVDFADYLDLIGSSAGLYMGTGHTDFLGSSCAITKKLFHAFDCGTCEVKPEKPYNDFRDMYNTSISVILPYCGTVELTPAEVMYRNLRAYYYVDFQSGACTAVVEVEGDSGWYMVASKTGQMGFLLPITATNAGQLSAQFGKDATETLGTLAGWFFDTAKTIGNGLFGMAGSYLNKKSSEEEKLMGVGRAGFDMLVNHGQTNVGTGIELVNQSLDRLSRSGIDMPMLSGGGGTEALMFPDTPYIQIRRGKYAKPENYPHSQGFLNGSSNTIEYYKGAFQGSPTIDPSYQGRGLCKFTGVDSTGLTCNNDERVEIVALLESGIYI